MDIASHPLIARSPAVWTDFDEISESSLSKRVCDLDLSLEVATEQVRIVEETDEYLKLGNSLGMMMCTLALLAWYLTLSQELASVLTTLKVTPRRLVFLVVATRLPDTDS